MDKPAPDLPHACPPDLVQVSSGKSPPPPFCGDKKYVSPEESAALKAMRQVHQRALPLRRRLRAEDLTPPERRELEQEVARLRQRFHELRRQLHRANTEKLRRLGHL